MPKAKQKDLGLENAMPASAAVLIAANPVAAKAWMDLMTEGTTFMQTRLEEALEFQQKLMTCRSPVEMMQLQSDFMQATWQAYSAEATRYLDLAVSSAGAISQDAKTGHRRKYDDVPV